MGLWGGGTHKLEGEVSLGHGSSSPAHTSQLSQQRQSWHLNTLAHFRGPYVQDRLKSPEGVNQGRKTCRPSESLGIKPLFGMVGVGIYCSISSSGWAFVEVYLKVCSCKTRCICTTLGSH